MKEPKSRIAKHPKPLKARDIEVGARYRHTNYCNFVYLGCGRWTDTGYYKKFFVIIEGPACVGNHVNLTRDPNFATGFIKL